MSTIISFDEFAEFVSNKLGYDRNDLYVEVNTKNTLVPYWEQIGVNQYLADDEVNIYIHSYKFEGIFTPKELLQVDNVYPIVEIKDEFGKYFNGSLLGIESSTYEASVIGFKY